MGCDLLVMWFLKAVDGC